MRLLMILAVLPINRTLNPDYVSVPVKVLPPEPEHFAAPHPGQQGCQEHQSERLPAMLQDGLDFIGLEGSSLLLPIDFWLVHIDHRRHLQVPFGTQDFKIEGNTLTITVKTNKDGPVANPMTIKFVRVE